MSKKLVSDLLVDYLERRGVTKLFDCAATPSSACWTPCPQQEDRVHRHPA